MPETRQVSDPAAMPETRQVSDPGVRWAAPDSRVLALRIRLRAVRMVAPQGFGYLGQALSSAEQVAAVFAAARPGVDRHRLPEPAGADHRLHAGRIDAGRAFSSGD